MEILTYDSEMAEELVGVYNKAVRQVPHCYPVTEEEFGAALAPAAGQGISHERLHSETAFVARDGRKLLGFINAAIERTPKGEEKEQGAIRFLSYPRGRRAVGQALLDAAEHHLRDCGMRKAIAFHQDYRYRFYHLKNAYLSDHLDHVQALLAFNGYGRCAGEVFLDWPDYEPQDPGPVALPLEMRVARREGRGARPGLSVTAVRGRRRLGECECLSGGEFSDAADAQLWAFVVWLGVEDDVQGRGLGRHLLQRAIQELHGIGYRHASISTKWDNHRAFLFYSNAGFHAVDWTYGFRRTLTSDAG